MAAIYTPTEEQKTLIDYEGSAFVTACPGAGKTRTMVERARKLLGDPKDGRSIAFLSFTNAAIDELESRLRNLSVLPVPLFPNYIATFDSFLWQFFIVPFGIPDCEKLPRLIPDKNYWPVKSYPKDKSPLDFRFFDRETGSVKEALLRQEGLGARMQNITSYENKARNAIEKFLEDGEIDFEDIRKIVDLRLSDRQLANRLGQALSARFSEIIVDEAQDCNPSDLEIVKWMLDTGISVKLICDPNQAIYQFRGGITNELIEFSSNFDPTSHLQMSGNFRSNPAICRAIVQLRLPSNRSKQDKPMGDLREDQTPVYILSYSGKAVSAKIGEKFESIIKEYGISPDTAPVVAATRDSAFKAVGQPIPKHTEHLTLLLAQALVQYEFAFNIGNRREALVNLHRVVLLIKQKIQSVGEYHKYLLNNGIENADWRPEIIKLANALRIKESEDSDDWLARARSVLKEEPSGNQTINQRLRNSQDLPQQLKSGQSKSVPARTIHSVKGLEFPAICVVMTTKSKGILDLLEGLETTTSEEEVRKIYVGASRAERLLAIAVPKSQANRLHNLFKQAECNVEVINIA